MSPPGIKAAALDFPAEHLIRLAIGKVKYLSFTLLQNYVMNNTWQYIFILVWFCVFMQSLNVNSNK